MNLSCEVICDLLPLYHDGVCSGESRALVEEHLNTCPACRSKLEELADASRAQNLDEAKLIRDTAKTYKKHKAAAFFKGALIISVLACAACVIAFNLIGSYVADDGTLVEPFGLIPLFWLFALLAILFAVCLAVCLAVSRRRRK